MMLTKKTKYNAFCATVDLLGIKNNILNHPHEALQRINDLQKSFADNLFFFPGGQDYRVCFAGDSYFIIKEMYSSNKLNEKWSIFCGHIFAISSFINEMEKGIGNPGLRVIISYGELLPIYEPEIEKYKLFEIWTKNWFVLTGASEALVKCQKAELKGRKGGFLGNHCWHEDICNPFSFWGTPIEMIELIKCRNTELYPTFYKDMYSKAQKNNLKAFLENQ